MHGTDADVPDSDRPTVEMPPDEMAVFYARGDEDDNGDGPPTEKRPAPEEESAT